MQPIPKFSAEHKILTHSKKPHFLYPIPGRWSNLLTKNLHWRSAITEQFRIMIIDSQAHTIRTDSDFPGPLSMANVGLHTIPTGMLHQNESQFTILMGKNEFCYFLLQWWPQSEFRLWISNQTCSTPLLWWLEYCKYCEGGVWGMHNQKLDLLERTRPILITRMQALWGWSLKDRQWIHSLMGGNPRGFLWQEGLFQQ